MKNAAASKPAFLACYRALQGTPLASFDIIPANRGRAIIILRAHKLAAESRPSHGASRFNARRYAAALAALAA